VIIYLHGFNSGGVSQKATWLREHLAPAVVFAPTYEPHHALATARFLRKFIRRLKRENPDERRLLLIGSSLGGFWAQYLAPEFQASMVLINPSLRPDISLANHTGRYSNVATGGPTVLTTGDIAGLAAYRTAPCRPEVPTLLLLDTDDDVLDYREAAAAYSQCGRTLVYPGGSHRFEHLPQALPMIRDLYLSGKTP